MTDPDLRLFYQNTPIIASYDALKTMERYIYIYIYMCTEERGEAVESRVTMACV